MRDVLYPKGPGSCGLVCFRVFLCETLDILGGGRGVSKNPGDSFHLLTLYPASIASGIGILLKSF